MKPSIGTACNPEVPDEKRSSWSECAVEVGADRGRMGGVYREEALWKEFLSQIMTPKVMGVKDRGFKHLKIALVLLSQYL